MAYNICICGTNHNFYISRFINEKIVFDKLVEEKNKDDIDLITEEKSYYTNMFFFKYNIDRICCRQFYISYIDYCPSIF